MGPSVAVYLRQFFWHDGFRGHFYIPMSMFVCRLIGGCLLAVAQAFEGLLCKALSRIFPAAAIVAACIRQGWNISFPEKKGDNLIAIATVQARPRSAPLFLQPVLSQCPGQDLQVAALAVAARSVMKAGSVKAAQGISAETAFLTSPS